MLTFYTSWCGTVGIRKELAALRADPNMMSPNGVANRSPPPQQTLDKHVDHKQPNTSSVSKGGAVADLGRVKKHLSTVLDSGLYEDKDDPLVKELLKTVQTT